jgi:oligoendopeptidase F
VGQVQKIVVGKKTGRTNRKIDPKTQSFDSVFKKKKSKLRSWIKSQVEQLERTIERRIDEARHQVFMEIKKTAKQMRVQHNVPPTFIKTCEEPKLTKRKPRKMTIVQDVYF